MSDIPIKYSLETDLRSGEPIGLYRMFCRPGRAPESLKRSQGWIPMPQLLYYLSSGEITEDDRVDEMEAGEIAHSWGETL
jgi:hypothetical protein